AVNGEARERGDLLGGARAAPREGVEEADAGSRGIRGRAAPAALRPLDGRVFRVTSVVGRRGKWRQLGDLIGTRDADRVVLAQEPVASGRRGARDGPGDRAERPAESCSVSGGVERAGAGTRL